MLILGIESSCDETAAAVVEDGKRILSNAVASQIETHRIYGGVVPEIASRMHTEAISGIVGEALRQAGAELSDIGAVAVTYAPGLIGAVLTGVSYAKGLSFMRGLPLVPVHHIRGHISVLYTMEEPPEPPFLALCASGGHSSIIEVKGYTFFKTVAVTRDDAAGEAYDKVSRVLGLGYPGGPAVEKAAMGITPEGSGIPGDPEKYRIPEVSFPGSFDFSFSGVKTAVMNIVNTASQRGEAVDTASLAASFNATVAGTLTRKLMAAAEELGYDKIAAVGGVSANGELRRRLAGECDRRGFRLYLPDKKLSGDNGVMPAAGGYYELLAGNTASTRLNAAATMPPEADCPDLKR